MKHAQIDAKHAKLQKETRKPKTDMTRIDREYAQSLRESRRKPAKE